MTKAKKTKKKKLLGFEQRWNEIFGKLVEARKEWKELQEDLNGVDWNEIERDYSAAAQGMLTKFRNVRFDRVVPMWVSFWRGRGGVETMLIEAEEVVVEEVEAPPLRTEAEVEAEVEVN